MPGKWIGYWLVTLLLVAPATAQRKYADHSVLATGNWFKIGIKETGIYKVDVNLLTSLGINTNNLNSNSIRLFGNGAQMLPENNAAIPIDDLAENAIDVSDGGDGIFNGNDYFLFYAQGPDKWLPDSSNQSFRFVKNLYTDTAWYFISIGGTGKRMSLLPAGTPGTLVNSFDDRYAYDNNLINPIASGKQWLGEAFGTTSGSVSNRNFNIDLPGLIGTEPIRITSSQAGRSIGSNSSFTLSLNGVNAPPIVVPAVSGNFLDRFANLVATTSVFNSNTSSLMLRFAFQSTSADAQGWLNDFSILSRRTLQIQATTPLFFRDWRSVAPNRSVTYQISGADASTVVWDISTPLSPVKMPISLSGNLLSFHRDASRLREFVAFGLNQLKTPFAAGKQPNQDLHGLPAIEYLIITHPSLFIAANRLATFHTQQFGRNVRVVTTDQVYTEFAGGNPDPTAVRDLVKMLYDRAGADIAKRPKYLLLFGAASFDYRNRIPNNTNLVPAFESEESLDPLSSITSDDFFGLLDDTDDINAGTNNALLDIAIGRIPARNISEANTLVDKIIRYHQPASLGNWRNQLLFVGDDKDQNLHLNDAESLVAQVTTTNASMNIRKLYLDAFPLVSGSGGARYPQVNDAIVGGLNNGSLIFNYTGHGNHLRLADEAVLTIDEANRLNNADRLPLMVTASCDFYPFDDPTKNSVGEQVLTGTANGAIALLTTARLVFAFSNRIIHEQYLRAALNRMPNGQYPTLGEAVAIAKNNTLLQGGGILNTRKFVLLGDPAMSLAFPRQTIRLTRVNGRAIGTNDTLKAAEKVELEGMVENLNGGVDIGFNGRLYPTVFDQAQSVKTLGNDVTSPITSFQQQSGILYKGNATITNGRFRFAFVLPKDISFQPGKCRISLYAENGITDAGGVDTSFFTIGTNAAITDTRGPNINLWLNDTLFKQGGLTNASPVLLARFLDSSGINTSGNSIGHDITLIIDGNQRAIQVLNDAYVADNDRYTSGSLRFQLPTLLPGPHYLVVKAWDVVNNSGEARLNFTVAKSEALEVTALRNFPNPFTDQTRFSFEHNQPNTNLQVTIQVFHSDGRLIKRIAQTVNTAGNRNISIGWDGRDESGRKTEKGVYIYRVMVVSGQYRFSRSGQLILL